MDFSRYRESCSRRRRLFPLETTGGIPGLAQLHLRLRDLGLLAFESPVPSTVAGGDSGPDDHVGRGSD